MNNNKPRLPRLRIFLFFGFFMVLFPLLAKAQWTILQTGVTQNLHAVYFINASTGFAVGDSGLVITTANGGASWSKVTVPATVNLNAIAFASSTRGTVVGVNGTILQTTNGGASWTLQTSGITYNLNGIFYSTPDTGIAVGESGTILITQNGGDHWTDIFSGSIYLLNQPCFINDSLGYVVGNGSTVLYTTDGGSAWDTLGNIPGSLLQRLYAITPVNSNSLLICGSSGTLLTLNHNGVCTPIISGTDRDLHGLFCLPGGTCLCVGDQGTILRSGNPWIADTAGISNDLYSVFALDTNTAYIAGTNGTILKNSHAHLAGIPELKNPVLDGTVYPNPFSDTFTLSFYLPSETVVKAALYAMDGRQAGALVNGRFAAGNHSVKIDPAFTIKQGVYFLKIYTPAADRVIKIVKID